MTERELRAKIVQVGRLLWERDLIGAGEGNISCRLNSNLLLATPRGRRKGELLPEDCVVIDREGTVQGEGVVSTEIRMHLRCYADRADCMAVVHAHPPVATAFALAGETLPDDLLPEAAHFLGPVALVPFAMPGTDEVPDAMKPFLASHKTFLIANHGATTIGRDLDDAYNRMETLERVARVIFAAREIGNPQRIPKRALQSLQDSVLHGKL